MFRKDKIDVVVDLARIPFETRALFLEILLSVDEGIRTNYHFNLGSKRLDKNTQEILIDFLNYKGGTFCSLKNNIKFPKLLIDQELDSGLGERDIKRTKAKEDWFESNIALLDAINHYDDFVFLSSASIPLGHGWLKRLVTAGREGHLPVLGCPRKVEIDGSLRICGWSSTGWYDGRKLRPLPLEKAFRDRKKNPWKEFAFSGNCDFGPAFCLSGDWLSGFDIPSDFLLFALYFEEVVNGNALEWSKLAESYQKINLVLCSEDESILIKHSFKDGMAALMHMRTDNKDTRVDVLKRIRDLSINSDSRSSTEIDEKIFQYPIGMSATCELDPNDTKLQLEELKDIFKGERCFVIGNGPSLNKTDLTYLKNEFTIGLNRIYLNYPNMGFQPSMLCITNPNIVRQFSVDINRLQSIKFLNYKTRGLIKNRWNTFFFESNGKHDFYKDLSDYIWCDGCTVTYCALQVAYYMGFREVFLVGVDHSFSDSGTPNKLVESQRVDINHFHKDYFSAGVEWQYPDLDCSKISYKVAKSVYEKSGRKILDATVDGKLDVFEKFQYASLFKR